MPFVKWRKKPAFCLYVIPDYVSDAPEGSPVKFFSETPQEQHPSSAVAMSAKVIWWKMPLTARMKEFSRKYKDKCEGDDAFDLYFVPEKPEPFGLWCQLHAHVEDGMITQLQVFLRRGSKDPKQNPPPPEITHRSKELGGYPEGLKAVFKEFDNKKRDCKASVDFVFFRDVLKIRSRRKKLVVPNFKVNDEQLSLTKSDGTQVKVDFYKDSYSIEVESGLKLAANPSCFENACASMLERITPLLNLK